MTPSQFAAKVDHEGGLYEAVAGYGLSERDLDDTDQNLRNLIKAYAARTAELAPLEYEIEGILDEWIEGCDK